MIIILRSNNFSAPGHGHVAQPLRRACIQSLFKLEVPNMKFGNTKTIGFLTLRLQFALSVNWLLISLTIGQYWSFVNKLKYLPGRKWLELETLSYKSENCPWREERRQQRPPERRRQSGSSFWLRSIEHLSGRWSMNKWQRWSDQGLTYPFLSSPVWPLFIVCPKIFLAWLS
jgi:hypothetical protein